MKKVITTISLIAATIINASYSENRIELSLSAGLNKFDSDSRLKSNAQFYGIRATMYESELNKYGFQLAYEGAFNVDYDDLKVYDKYDKSNIHRLYSNVIVDGEEEYNIIPYLIFGLGYEYLSDEIKGETSQGIADIGIGFKYDLGNSLNSAIEVRGIGKFDTGDVDYVTHLVFSYDLNSYNNVQNLSQHEIEFKKQISQVSKPVGENIQTIINEINIDNSKDIVENQQTKESVVKYQEDDELVQTTFAQASNNIDNVDYTNEYYIEMAAYRVTPAEPLKNKIINSGYSNVIIYPELNSKSQELNLVLVGPYNSKSEAKKELKNLRKISHDAFIMRMH